MYISGSTANSQRMVTEISESSTISKKGFEWKVMIPTTFKIKAFIIISNKMKIPLIILS